MTTQQVLERELVVTFWKTLPTLPTSLGTLPTSLGTLPTSTAVPERLQARIAALPVKISRVQLENLLIGSFDELVSHISEELADGMLSASASNVLAALCVKLDPNSADWLGM